MGKYILAIDAGTSSCRAILVNKRGSIVASEQKEYSLCFPRPGWVEQDPEELWQCVLSVMHGLFSSSDYTPSCVHAMGITNQRETSILWDKESGTPLGPAIVWQDRRTAELCQTLRDRGLEEKIHSRTGLIIDAYFSATKIKWLLDNTEGLREKANREEVLFGTVDSWLVWKLTGGKEHITDSTNASRTLLYNINSGKWDEELCSDFDIPFSLLPNLRPSSALIAETHEPFWKDRALPICGIAGDQHAALFGHTCFQKGSAKVTYGTGSFILMNIGSSAVKSTKGLLCTLAWDIAGEKEYALEGSIFVTGSAIQWLRDGLNILQSVEESETLAMSVADSHGCYVVPAFAGLGAPYWDMNARGIICGLTRGVKKEHIVRATLESLAYQTKDVLISMENDSQIAIQELRVDGGVSHNNFLMQFQSDMLDIPLTRPHIIEKTALGAAYLAGLASEYWQDKKSLETIAGSHETFHPEMATQQRNKTYAGWKKAVERARHWEE